MNPIYEENIKMRFFKQEDAEEVRRLADHPDLAQMIGLPHPYLLSYAEKYDIIYDVFIHRTDTNLQRRTYIEH